jgi:putative transposase
MSSSTSSAAAVSAGAWPTLKARSWSRSCPGQGAVLFKALACSKHWPVQGAVLFKELFDETCAKQGVLPGQLTLHADRGGPMQARPTAFLLADLGVSKSHSRPPTSNHNPFAEAHFKTLKYHPQCPRRCGCIEDARAFCRRFFTWYNQDHHHVGIGLMTPDQVHDGQANIVHAARQDALAQAYQANPERFVRKAPVPPPRPTQTWINPPRKNGNQPSPN